MVDALFAEHRERYKERCRQHVRCGGNLRNLRNLLPGVPPAVHTTFKRCVYPGIANVYFASDLASNNATVHLRNVYRQCPDLCHPDPVCTLVLATHARLGKSSPARHLSSDILRHVHSFLPTRSWLLQMMAIAANLSFFWRVGVIPTRSY